ncbi:23S rRNA (adenine(2030)-N(6))-methyltransferase RlmJ [Methyloversatilis sp.]|uniref:23S rRNA (adenine(2030)-N(6))-methyltransferase RlmJ n=1 Tax=Methyloversatilis sp. TaxID=2569862 RepID=UPI0027340B14|nr:23S rRNA (adenine(2030)-N(6))-methyltransferase RlmJ [Methyloversatilis sp.]MDP2867410.1 23S rRNA (adenine(2030)-N(6))-methyltransferase RlmJ [Methyloversatilis sp.]MDP3457537.1 23S rRNA (adenine(2030)-N(6))-methyltransferase RlmJ [Methyloversatilis sp.]MDP3578116.1 23S rRNA (adenine(2030)-N(6))-methyltransferase RlmJ [Methyloversatilis sp.]
MLSYRHAFHAGNPADVLKHFVLVELLQHLNQKDKPYWYIDTHAGAGGYALDSGFAAKNAEYAGGIAKLWSAPDLPPQLATYVDLVRAFNSGAKLRAYPGSPMIARALLRDDDRMRLFELHTADNKLLNAAFAEAGRSVKVDKSDGFSGLRTLLPPPPRRALVLIDPPYEIREDYRLAFETLRDANTRFPGGTYCLWYPQLHRMESRDLPAKLKRLPVPAWLHVTLTTRKPSPDGFGMHGSGLFIVNPPWTLPATLKTVMPWLTRTLALDDGAKFELEFKIP